MFIFFIFFFGWKGELWTYFLPMENWPYYKLVVLDFKSINLILIDFNIDNMALMFTILNIKLCFLVPLDWCSGFDRHRFKKTKVIIGLYRPVSNCPTGVRPSGWRVSPPPRLSGRTQTGSGSEPFHFWSRMCSKVAAMSISLEPFVMRLRTMSMRM